jgi:DNA-binding transcriptional LysR family regulator
MHDHSRLLRLDLNLFRVFEAVHRERNLSRAAESLALSQSAVSHALARLRRQVGDPLFRRQGKGVVPTLRAEQLAPSVQQALAGLRQAVQSGGSFEPRRDLGRLILAMRDEMEPILLPALCARLRTAAPQIAVASVRLDRAALKADLAAGRIDLAVDVAQSTDTELRHQPLLHDDFCVVSAPGRGRLSLRAYLDAGHIAVSSRRSGPAFEDFILNRRGLDRRVVLRCQSYEAACRIAANSDLLLTMPRRQASTLRSASAVRLLKPPLDLPPFETHLYWHRQMDQDPGSQWLRRVLLETAAAQNRRRSA